MFNVSKGGIHVVHRSTSLGHILCSSNKAQKYTSKFSDVPKKLSCKVKFLFGVFVFV